MAASTTSPPSISTRMPVSVGSVSSRPAATATCATAWAKVVPATVPLVVGMTGSAGYSSTGSVGSVNAARPHCSSTRVPSVLTCTGWAGSARAMSASSRPDTRVRPGSSTTASTSTRALTSKSNEDSSSPSGPASTSRPASIGMDGRAGSVRAAHCTASARTSRSTRNFTAVLLS